MKRRNGTSDALCLCTLYYSTVEVQLFYCNVEITSFILWKHVIYWLKYITTVNFFLV